MTFSHCSFIHLNNLNALKNDKSYDSTNWKLKEKNDNSENFVLNETSR